MKPDFLISSTDARVHKACRFCRSRVGVSQGIKSPLNAVSVRDGILPQAPGQSLVEILLNCRLFDAFLIENRVDKLGPGLEEVDPFNGRLEDSA